MSVVGFDIGNANCYVAIAKAGGIETADNEYSDRCTPAYVGFNEKVRLTGVAAKNQGIINFKNTIHQIKRFIGRSYDDPFVQSELGNCPFKATKMEDGSLAFQVQYRLEVRHFTPEQIMAMLMQELKQTAMNKLKSQVSDCVICVPSFFTDCQRVAMVNAAEIAGLNCQKLLNETTAVALNYGLFKQDLPAADAAPRHVVFVDMGHSAMQVSVCAFNKGKMKVLSIASDPCLGGRNFDYKLRDYFAEEFKKKYRLDCKTQPRPWLRLLSEVEKIKKQMSSNSTNLILNIECFMEDRDVSHTVNRSIFEEMCADLFGRVEKPLQQALHDSGLTTADIHFVEIVGGSTRMPAVKNTIQQVFSKEISTTLNADEAVSRGCSIQSAMLSHTVRVRDIEVQDAATYPIYISWDAKRDDDQRGEMEIFSKHHSYPATKLLTLQRKEPFSLRAYYSNETKLPHPVHHIGEFVVNGVTATPSGDTVKVKVKVRLDGNGCFTVHSAHMVEKLPTPPPSPTKEEPMETEQPADSAANETAAPANAEAGTNEKAEEKKDATPTKEPEKEKTDNKAAEKKKAKKNVKTTDLNVDISKSGMKKDALNSLIEVENELQMQIKVEKQLADAKNAVEEYVYDMRAKISDEYEEYIQETQREAFDSLLSATEDWLYEDGADEMKQVYVDKLAELKKVGDTVTNRFAAHNEIPSAFEAFGSLMTRYKKVMDLYAQKDEKYAHIEEKEMEKVKKRLEEKFKWFNSEMNSFQKLRKYESPKIMPSQIQNEIKLLSTFCDPIINKPKPKVEPPKEETNKDGKATEKTEESNAQKAEENTTENKEQTNASESNKENIEMDVD